MAKRIFWSKLEKWHFILYSAGGSVNWYKHLRKHLGLSSKDEYIYP